MFSRRYTPEFKTQIPHKAQFQLTNERLGHKLNEYWRLFRRELYLLLRGQKALERKFISQSSEKILWLAPSIRNIGDAIMILSGRKLLVNQFELDVLVDNKVAPLFSHDECFNQVYTDVRQITTQYDLIILDSVKSISLKNKLRYFPRTPFCHFRGHFDGVEFNWTLFSFHRMNALLHYPYNQCEIDQLARPFLNLSTVEEYPEYDLILAVGGEDLVRRTYTDWLSVIQMIVTYQPQIKIGLLGNENGLASAKSLVTYFPLNCVSFVGKTSLIDVMGIIKQAKSFLGCDGGLMHIATAFEKSGVALFGMFEPEYRLPYNSKINPLYDAISVNNITPKQVAESYIAVVSIT